MSTPDVTVVVAVFNTMPYLSQCLDSVLGQSLGADRLEIVAVDDGSTDGSAAELDRYAERHPGTVTVIHQANSGGPAAPSNRALEVARGRYVFFLGADDYLGDQALERLVRVADERDADIVLGKLVGVGGRGVNQAVYARDRDDLTLVNSALPWALSNTKLFRRSLIEEHHLRFPEELRSGSDQPFTLRAVAAARRIAVRGEDYDFYYAVRRTDASNITYRTSLSGFVHSTAVIMDTAADVITDPEALARVHRRHFTWELGKLLGERFLDADAEEQRLVQDGVRKLAEQYLTEPMRASLDVQRRIPLSVAQFGSLDDLRAVVRHYLRDGLSPMVADGQRCYAALPGFRDPDRGFAQAWFDITALVRKRIGPPELNAITTERAADGRPVLVVSVRSPIPELGAVSVAPPQMTAGPARAALHLAEADGERAGGVGPGTDVRAEFDPRGLAVADGPQRIRFVHTTLGTEHVQDLPGPARVTGAGLRFRRGVRYFTVRARRDRQGRLMLVVTPITPRRLVAGLVRRLRPRARKVSR
ncbi:glycosyltransferase family 2 protein [Mangrovihabitans endophyticus]|uniref:Glycosyl transferase family 2 n=1 Tax=Mangrovihabitans endophyticus TaxID=1751298 RepID=A0A8J3C4N4_9ACTN|nr:glycosyltransferase [Mangrovihabitans endophyticus]GGL08754.1 hypothetical protein GCM10012284_49240 [Mangrovihabitans endophyticus]